MVKGPASLPYGSDAVAGVVNLLPALPRGPEGKLQGEALAEYFIYQARLFDAQGQPLEVVPGNATYQFQ